VDALGEVTQLRETGLELLGRLGQLVEQLLIDPTRGLGVQHA
jgi:hypothetical protein